MDSKYIQNKTEKAMNVKQWITVRININGFINLIKRRLSWNQEKDCLVQNKKNKSKI